MFYNNLNRKSFLLLILFLLPTLFLGYTADDRQWMIAIHFFNNSFTDNSLSYNIVNALNEMDRFFPISIILLTITNYVFDYSNVFFYHFYLLIVTIISIICYFKWIKKVLPNTNFSSIIYIATAIIQYRLTYSDPVASYTGFIQILTILFFLGQIQLNSYYKNEKSINLIFYILLLITQLLIYELAFFINFLFLIETFFSYKASKNFKKYIPVFIIYFIINLVYIIIYLYYKNHAVTIYSGTKLNLDLFLIFKTILSQFVGSLPYSYLFYILNIKLNIFNYNLIWIFYIIFIILISFLLHNKKFIDTILNNKKNLCYGFFIMFFSAASISISKLYQIQIEPGLLYINGYLQNLGFIILIYPFINLNPFKNKVFLFIIIIFNFIINTFLIFENIKVDNSKKLELLVMKIIANDNTSHYNETIFNEKLFQNDFLYNKYFYNNFGKSNYINLSKYLSNKPHIYNNTGILLTSNNIENKIYAISGNLSYQEPFIIDSPSFYFLNYNLARIKSMNKYPIKTFKFKDNVVFYFKSSDNFLINNLKTESFR